MPVKTAKPETLLLRWYTKHGRKLPWRNTRNAYRILVSEIMLQQTQVSRVKEKYKEWLSLFPNWNSLASASNADVIHAWAGLGYNRRALALRDIAKQVVEQGEPTTREEWLALKGVGPYTSAALASFSLHHRELPIDTNIRRVLGRALLGIHFPQLEDDERIDAVGKQLVATSKKHFDVPQAIFDLATSHCVKMPDCATCPLVTQCKAAPDFLAGRIEEPKRMTKKATERIQEGKKYPDRIYRGRILKLVREQREIAIGAIGAAIDPTFDPIRDSQWIEELVKRLKKDNLVQRQGSVVKLS